MRSFITQSLWLLLFSAAVSSQAATIRVFLLGGQSNMFGRGATSGLPTELQSPQSDVLFYEGGTLRDLQPGSGSDFGPEITFGRQLADTFTAESFGLIKYARGGTSLSDDWDPDTGSDYTTFTNTVTDGLAAITAQGHDYEIAGMLWTQGERDAKLGRTSAQYEADLAGFVADVRTRYGNDLPFLLSRLSSGQTDITTAQLTEIRSAQENFTISDPKSWMIDTDGMGIQSDELHFNADGQISLGESFANTYASAVPEPSSFALLAGSFGLISVMLRRR